MKQRVLVLVLVLLGAAPAAAQQPKAEAADVILTNARIYTVDPELPRAEAIAVRGEKIVAVGKRAEVERYRGAKTEVIDAGGRLVLPGFVDSHIHFLGGALSLEQLDLLHVRSLKEAQRLLREYAAERPDAPWLVGRGWVYTMFGEEGLPHRSQLDEVVADRPVLLSSSDGHSAWANTRALEVAGITRETPDPPNGIIVREAKTGEPTGALKEAAMGLVRRHIPAPTDEQRLAALRNGMQHASQHGITRAHSCGGDFDALPLYARLRDEGALTVRMYIAQSVGPKGLDAEQMNRIEAARKQYRDDWLSGGAVKLMLDGVVEAHTAAMLAPYSDDPSRRGEMFWSADVYKSTVAELDRRGIQLFTHSIGDAAVRLALDGYEHAQKTNKTRDARHRIEHIEVAEADDLARFGPLGVIGSFQPLHADPDPGWMSIWSRNVGKERLQRAFAWQAIVRGGGKLTFGSDWPVVTLNPWPGLRNAVLRQSEKGFPPGGWVPKERVTLEQAIRAYTLDAAYAGRREKTEGSLTVGKLADLIVLSQDLFAIDASDIGRTEVLLTMVGGKVVHRVEGLGKKH